jgi:hypothetical protein
MQALSDAPPLPSFEASLLDVDLTLQKVVALLCLDRPLWMVVAS